MSSVGECCNPAARRDQDRCMGCPIRGKSGEKKAAERQPEPPKERKPSSRGSELWRMLHEEFTRE